MTDADHVTFVEVFQRLRSVFPLRGEAREIEQIIRVYFRALSRFDVDAVERGADEWMSKGTKFPKPAEWISVVPRGASAIQEATPTQAKEYYSALARRFEDDPCSCVACKSAGISHRMLRYVPDHDADDRDIQVQFGRQVLVLGHWAHGEELARWYRARDEFMALASKVGLKPKAIPTTKTQTLKQVAAYHAHPGEEVVETEDTESNDAWIGGAEVDARRALEDANASDEPVDVGMSMESEWPE